MSIHRIPLKEEPFTGNILCSMYDQHAKLYMMPVYRHFARKIAHLNINSPRVLDIGTGSGLLSIEIAKIVHREFHITATDISEDMLLIARENILKAGLSQKIETKICSASALPFADHSFDLVVSNASLHHWINPLIAFSEIKRVTRNGGFCLIRDNMRLSPFFSPFVKLIAFIKGMNQTQYNLWMNAIRASYNPSEIEIVLKQSEIKDYKISINSTFLDLEIKCIF
jgi:ubiquinone/menaquinone biosynthesis C-methylase UbiE